MGKCWTKARVKPSRKNSKSRSILDANRLGWLFPYSFADCNILLSFRLIPCPVCSSPWHISTALAFKIELSCDHYVNYICIRFALVVTLVTVILRHFLITRWMFSWESLALRFPLPFFHFPSSFSSISFSTSPGINVKFPGVLFLLKLSILSFFLP